MTKIKQLSFLFFDSLSSNWSSSKVYEYRNSSKRCYAPFTLPDLTKTNQAPNSIYFVQSKYINHPINLYHTNDIHTLCTSNVYKFFFRNIIEMDKNLNILSYLLCIPSMWLVSIMSRFFHMISSSVILITFDKSECIKIKYFWLFHSRKWFGGIFIQL